MSDEGRLVAGRYRLGRRIGTGAMGIVWQAQDERLNRTVAVKQLLLQAGLSAEEAGEAKLRAMREGRIAARLHHPNAITVFDVVDEDGAPWLIMEYLQSKSLAAVMNERGPLAPTDVARIGSQIAAALAAAHAAGIVHRDIKPANILLGDNGSVKITDFGISRASDDVQVTKTGLIAGTPAYLAPEVAYGREPTAATDVFSLGSTLYAATEGEPPFGLSENTLGLLHAVAAGRINPPQNAGPLAPVLAVLLATEPEDRPPAAQAREMLDAVANGQTPDVPLAQDAATVLVGEDPGEARTRLVAGDSARTRVVGGPRSTGTSLRPAPEPTRRSRAPLAVGAVVLAALMVGGAFFLLKDNNQRTGTDPTPINGAPSSTLVVPTSELPPTSEAAPSSEKSGTSRTGGNRSRSSAQSSAEQPPPESTTVSPTRQSSSPSKVPSSKPPSSRSSAPSSEGGG